MESLLLTSIVSFAVAEGSAWFMQAEFYSGDLLYVHGVDAAYLKSLNYNDGEFGTTLLPF